MHGIVFTQIYYIETLKIPTCFDPTGSSSVSKPCQVSLPKRTVPKNCVLSFTYSVTTVHLPYMEQPTVCFSILLYDAQDCGNKIL
jgi:hypothetical protein